MINLRTILGEIEARREYTLLVFSTDADNIHQSVSRYADVKISEEEVISDFTKGISNPFKPEVNATHAIKMKISTSEPLSPYVFGFYLSGELGLPVSYVVLIDSENRIIDFNDVKQISDKPLLSTDSEYSKEEQTAKGENYYGDKYNRELNKDYAYFGWLNDKSLKYTGNDIGRFGNILDKRKK